MKEVLISDKSLIYQWYFNDNMSVVDNYRVKSTVFGNPTYNNGVATFNGSTDYYKLKTLINLGTKYSIEIKAKAAFTANNDYVVGSYGLSSIMFDFYKTTNTISHFSGGNIAVWTGSYNPDLLWHTYTITRNGTSISLYIDGVLIANKTLEANTNFYFQSIGATDTGTFKYNGQLEYIKIWNRQLSPSEVKNNYNGKTYRALPYVSGEILGSELITNGTFNNLTSWNISFGAGAFTSDGNNLIINNPSGTPFIHQPITRTIGNLYKIVVNITSITGSLRVYFGEANNLAITTSGIYTIYSNAVSDNFIYIQTGGTCQAVISDISLKEVAKSSKNTLFHINSDNGVIRDLTGKTTPVATNVKLPKIGSNKSVMNFPKTQGNIVISNINTNGDITYMIWVNLRSTGASGLGAILGSLGGFNCRNSSNGFGFTRNGFTSGLNTAANTFKLSKSLFIAFTSTSTGISNCYIGDTINPPTLSEVANQNAGTPVNATTLELGGYIGRFMDGWRNDDRMEQSILTIEEITQFWSNTKYKY